MNVMHFFFKREDVTKTEKIIYSVYKDYSLGPLTGKLGIIQYNELFNSQSSADNIHPTHSSSLKLKCYTYITLTYNHHN